MTRVTGASDAVAGRGVSGMFYSESAADEKTAGPERVRHAHLWRRPAVLSGDLGARTLITKDD